MAAIYNIIKQFELIANFALFGNQESVPKYAKVSTYIHVVWLILARLALHFRRSVTFLKGKRYYFMW